MNQILEVLKRPFIWLKIFQMICGSICFGLLFHYYLGLREFVFYYAPNNLAFIITKCITMTAVVGYTFIIVVVIITSLFISGTSLETSPLCFLLNLAGFLMFLITGSCIAGYLRKDLIIPEGFRRTSRGIEGLAAMTIITSILFLCDIIIYGVQKFRRNA